MRLKRKGGTPGSTWSEGRWILNRISKQCGDLNLLLNPTKTQEMMSLTQLVKPVTPALNLNGTDITMCDKVRYLGITVDDKLKEQKIPR